ncbi:MAG TPA: hypothetical protein VFV95_18310 [Vicinamibacterales bacterium]|nr:hypothetical protein [Vicinamibacterales bacterium]
MVSRSRIALAAVVTLCAAAVMGEPAFRLEIGPPVAAGGAKKGLVFAVRALACSDPQRVRLTGTVEGVAQERRQSLQVRVVPYPTPGVYGIPNDWPAGVWVVSLTATCPSPAATAAAIVPIGEKGFLRDSTKTFDRAAPAAEIDKALKTLMASRRS